MLWMAAMLLLLGMADMVCLVHTVVSRKYAPPFAILTFVQSTGGLYAGCDIFSCDYALPQSRTVGAVPWMLASFLHCHSTMETLNLTV